MHAYRMVPRLVCLGVVSLLVWPGMSVAQPKEALRLSRAKLSVDDLAAVYGLNIYKWNLHTDASTRFRVVLREKDARDQPWKILFSEEIRAAHDPDDPNTTLTVSFTRRDGNFGPVFFTDQTEAQFRVKFCGDKRCYAGMSTTVPVPLVGCQGLLLTVHGSVSGASAREPGLIPLLTLRPSTRVVKDSPDPEHPRAELVLQVISQKAEAMPFAEGLSGAAYRTYVGYNKSIGVGKQEPHDGIPPECWAAPIKALHPIKVYLHRINVVVVQRVHDGIEEGKYIYIPISSYLPMSGDDGFEFTPNPLKGNLYTLGDGVFDFKRTTTAPPVGASVPRPTELTFGIYLAETGELLLSDHEVTGYIRATHEIKLNQSGIEKWNARLQCSQLPGGLYQEDFAVRLGDKEIYRGKFWSGYSSQSYEGVILDTAFRRDDTHDTIQLQYGYPGPLRGDRGDPRNKREIFDFFAERGKLK